MIERKERKIFVNMTMESTLHYIHAIPTGTLLKSTEQYIDCDDDPFFFENECTLWSKIKGIDQSHMKNKHNLVIACLRPHTILKTEYL